MKIRSTLQTKRKCVTSKGKTGWYHHTMDCFPYTFFFKKTERKSKHESAAAEGEGWVREGKSHEKDTEMWAFQVQKEQPKVQLLQMVCLKGDLK